MAISKPYGRSAPTSQEKAIRRARVAAAKDALARSAQMTDAHVVTARSALREYLRNLDAPRQPTDAAFDELLQAPFRTIERRQR